MKIISGENQEKKFLSWWVNYCMNSKFKWIRMNVKLSKITCKYFTYFKMRTGLFWIFCCCLFYICIQKWWFVLGYLRDNKRKLRAAILIKKGRINFFKTIFFQILPARIKYNSEKNFNVNRKYIATYISIVKHLIKSL